ncbi:Deuterolysin metalloprotease family-domain-containing protein [Geopyxis carbonaria]|nr:Deuterolysin metalloprotease family-domain-containing protein [Geopyxis carbonaria]
MVLTTTLFSCLSFIALAAAAPRPRNILDKRSTPLKVTLRTGTANGVVMAQITNTGSEDLSLLKHGSILSDQPIQKLNVYNGDEKLEFQGIKARYNLNKLSSTAYTTLKAGQTIDKEIDISGLYNLPSEGPYKISSGGAFSYVPIPTGAGSNTTTADDDVQLATFRPESIKSTGAIAYQADAISMTINHVEANKRSLAHQMRKRMTTSGCSGDHATALTNALASAADLAAKAATAAKSGDAAKFKEYFMTEDQTVRDTVAARFEAVAAAAGSVSGGSSSGAVSSAAPVVEPTQAPVPTVTQGGGIGGAPGAGTFPTAVTTIITSPGSTDFPFPGGDSGTGSGSNTGSGGFPGFPGWGFPGDTNAASASASGAAGAASTGTSSTTFPIDLGSLAPWLFGTTGSARLRPRQAGTGDVTYYCEDPMNQCETDVLAYTMPSQSIIANCPIYYSELPADTDTCHAQDQWSTSLHEMTHATAIFSPGTEDNGYGYQAATQLSQEQAVGNADTYALYAQAIKLSC